VVTARHDDSPDQNEGVPMRRIAVAALSTISGLVLLFSYHTSLDRSSAVPLGAAPGTGGGTTGRTPSGSAPATGSGGGSPGSSGSSGSGSSTEAAAEPRTVTGETADTRWGPVQVQITVAGGKVTAARTLQVPDGNFRDQEINSYAVPILNQEAVQAQSAQIDAVSGATVTSDGYIRSLQSALDQAHL
jgi:uncharacterized protein with FMN-binding domain